jgi:hypothetical protein
MLAAVEVLVVVLVAAAGPVVAVPAGQRALTALLIQVGVAVQGVNQVPLELAAPV